MGVSDWALRGLIGAVDIVAAGPRSGHKFSKQEEETIRQQAQRLNALLPTDKPVPPEGQDKPEKSEGTPEQPTHQRRIS